MFASKPGEELMDGPGEGLLLMTIDLPSAALITVLAMLLWYRALRTTPVTSTLLAFTICFKANVIYLMLMLPNWLQWRLESLLAR